MQSRITAGGGRTGSGGMQQKGKRTHEHGRGDCWGKVGIRGLNGNGKNTIKIKFFKKRLWL